MALPVFPTLVGITWPIVRRPQWATLKQDSVSGKRARIPQRTAPLYQWEVSMDRLRSDSAQDFQTLMGFYNSVNGAARAFSYTDQFDNSVTLQEFGQGDGATAAFQLIRSLGGFTEPVYLVSNVSMYVAGVLADPSTYTIGSTGIVTFTTAPSSGSSLTWSGNFAWVCRFDDDSIDLTAFANNYWSLSKLTFTSEVPQS